MEFDPNRVSKKGQTPFHLVNYLPLVKVFMKNYEIPPQLDVDGNHVFNNLLVFEFAEEALDCLIETNGYSLDSDDLMIRFHIKSFQTYKNKNKDIMMTYHKCMNECESQLIYHPISIVITQLRWACKSKLVRYLYPIIQFIFTTSLTWLIFCQFDKTTEMEPKDFRGGLDILTCQINAHKLYGKPECSISSNDKNTTDNSTDSNIRKEDPHCIAPVLISTTCLTLLVVFEFWQITRAPFKFFKKSVNWLDLFLVISSAISLVKIIKKILNKDGTDQISNLRFFSGISIFLAWFKIVILLQNLPKAGRYIRIFTIVAKELFFFLFIYLPILIAFGACFFVLLPPKTQSFKNSWTSGLKILAMLVGEVNFDGTFINNDDLADENESQILLLQIMSVCFLCFVSIVISNLLTGLAIKEIDALKSEAWQTSVREKTEELMEDDDDAYNRICTCFGNGLIKKLKDHAEIYVLPKRRVN